ncbi:hypothetical protein [Corynebacterium pacaense]|uniref:hypothetical protein n=1 Tax=Corynebacterium pacaense TaxID=1816684 RepID=UPI0009BB1609|nr:hypothetical protein [Corynebacterium pacaense]
MKDPTRIPFVIAELQATWEGQPDVSLSTLFGMLANRGIGWGSEDEELVAALREMRGRNPAMISGYSRLAAPTPVQAVTARYVIDTISPQHRITIDPFRVCVRGVDGSGEPLQPGVWPYSRVRRAAVGSPLLLIDSEGIDHRLGVVTAITMVDEHPTESIDSLEPMRRPEIGDRVFHISFSDGACALLDHGLTRFTVDRRRIDRRIRPWDRLIRLSVGTTLLMETAGRRWELGEVTRIISLEYP